MKTPNAGTLWDRAVKGLLSPWWRAQKPPDVDANTSRLWHIPENEPTFRCIMDHAVVKLGNHLQEAMTHIKMLQLKINLLTKSLCLRLN